MRKEEERLRRGQERARWMAGLGSLATIAVLSGEVGAKVGAGILVLMLILSSVWSGERWG